MSDWVVNTNKFLEKNMIIITPAGVILGLILGSRVSGAQNLVPYVFGAMTLFGTLSITFKDFISSIKPKAIVAYLLISHILLPLTIWALGSLIFHNEIDVRTGFILIYATPCAIVSSMWASIYGGDKPLSVAFVILDTLLSFFMTPLTVKFLCRTAVQIDMSGMVKNIMIMVVIPAILGLSISAIAKQKVNVVLPYTKLLSKGIVVFVCMISVSKVSNQLIDNISWNYLTIGIICLVMILLSYFVGVISSKSLKMNNPQIISVGYACGMRNLSMGLVLSTDFFPPMASIPIIIALTLQDIIGTIVGNRLRKIF